MEAKWKMSCNKCTFLRHDAETNTDWYLGIEDKTGCLLVKYGDGDVDYDFHVYFLAQPKDPDLNPGYTRQVPDALFKAWDYLKEIKYAQ